MNEKYKEYCMKFNNEELKTHLYDKLFEDTHVMWQCLSTDGEEIDITSNVKIKTIAFDEEENISIMFFGYQTSIFVFDIEIMFIDEATKNAYTSSDVYDNVVYEGKLREMSHKEMLEMFSEIILCFMDAEDVLMTELDAPRNKYKNYKYYVPHMFLIEVKNQHTVDRTNVYENIIIKY